MGIYDDGWTSGHACIDGVMPGFGEEDAYLRVRTRGWHPWAEDPVRLGIAVVVSGRPLPFVGADGEGYVFQLTREAMSLRPPIRLEIDSGTFVPEREGINLDVRDLGIDLVAIEVLDGRRQVARDIFRHPAVTGPRRSAEPVFSFDPGNPPIEELRKRGLKVGRNVAIHFGTVIDAAHYWLIEIGNGVTIAPCCHILAHDASTKAFLGYSRIGRVVIEDHVFIGANSVVLPGVTIGRSSVVGAGSVVTRDVPPAVVAAGNPSRVVCSLKEYMARRRAEFASAPRFGAEFTVAGGITDEDKARMREALLASFGYVL